MTLPYERVNAINNTRDFLYDLMDPKVTPRIPKIIRRRAHGLLRHYPSPWDVNNHDRSLP